VLAGVRRNPFSSRPRILRPRLWPALKRFRMHDISPSPRLIFSDNVVTFTPRIIGSVTEVLVSGLTIHRLGTQSDFDVLDSCGSVQSAQSHTTALQTAQLS
jgi:hypothetical protein